MAYVLFVALFASDTINQIITLAADIVFGHILSFCEVASNASRTV